MCAECGKTFKRRAALKEHEDLVHNMAPRFKCDLCHQAFMSKTLWKSHKLKHIDVSVYFCIIIRYKSAFRKALQIQNSYSLINLNTAHLPCYPQHVCLFFSQVRDCSEFLVRGVVLLLGGLPFLKRFLRGGV